MNYWIMNFFKIYFYFLTSEKSCPYIFYQYMLLKQLCICFTAVDTMLHQYTKGFNVNQYRSEKYVCLFFFCCCCCFLISGANSKIRDYKTFFVCFVSFFIFGFGPLMSLVELLVLLLHGVWIRHILSHIMSVGMKWCIFRPRDTFIQFFFW